MRSAVVLAALVAGVALTALAADDTKTITLGNCSSLTLHGLCADWKAYRTRDRDLVVVCPGIHPPAGAVELRAYYVVAP